MKYQEKVRMYQKIKKDLYSGQPEEAEGVEEATEEVQEKQLAQIMLLPYNLKKRLLNLVEINGQIKKLQRLPVILG